MKLRSTETYWLLKNGLINSYPSLRQDVSCDVLVVGGGITGALMAYQVAKEGYKTVLVDKRDVGMGSTSATTSLLQYEIDEPLSSLINKVGEAAAVDTYTEGVLAIGKLEAIIRSTRIDCSFENKTSLYIAHNKTNAKWLVKEFEIRALAGIKVSWLSQNQLWESYQLLGCGAILSETAASVDGYQLTHSLLAYSVNHHSLEVYDHTEVVSVEYSEASNSVRTNDSYTITCQNVIYATGYESQAMLKDKIVDLNSTYACVSEPLDVIPEIFSNTLIWNTQEPYLYVRSTSDNRILIGGEDEVFKNPERRDRLIEKKEMVLVKKFNQLMPSLKIIPDFSWAGTFGVTKDALPYIGPHPDFPNSYFALGFGGNGITFSVMGMQILSDALAGKHNKFLEHFRFKR